MTSHVRAKDETDVIQQVHDAYQGEIVSIVQVFADIGESSMAPTLHRFGPTPKPGKIILSYSAQKKVN